MKKIFLLALTAFSLYSCSEDEVVKNDQGDDPIAMICINVEGGALSGRAVEDGHAGDNGKTISPTIEKVHVLAYNEGKSLITAIELTADQMTTALYGDYKTAEGGAGNSTKPTGASVPLPKGTHYIDVILNQNENPDNTTNINYFNRVLTDGSTTFGRSPLVSTLGLIDLGKETPISTDGTIPVYKIDFTVQPGFARFEVYGGINVAAETDYVNYFENKWVKMNVSDFLAYVTTDLPDFNVKTLTDLQKTDGSCVAADGKITLYTGTGAAQVNLYGAMIANQQNGFDQSVVTNANIENTTLVYVPEYYWAYKGSLVATNPEPILANKIGDGNKAANLTEVGATKTWYNSGLLGKENTKTVQWCPNIYHAIDVEEIYINNIKVLSNNATTYLHPWPGSEATSFWPKWYEAYHEHGWHTAGKSANNTFLCMGNMWDRITDVTDGNSTDLTLTGVTDVGSGSGNLTMKYVHGKAAAKAGVSKFYSTSPDRNLGVADGKAAAYMFYPQSSTVSDTDKDGMGANLPHIILKVKAYESKDKFEKGEAAPNKNFITIRLFKDATSAYVKNFKSAYIYRVNLNDITQRLLPPPPVPNGVNPNPDTNNPIDPDPEMPGASLELTVQVLNWTIQNITPEI